MALIHRATLTPSKGDVLAAFLPTRPWADGHDLSSPNIVGAYRFDDPDGEVGIETHLVQSADGAVFQIPLTYRGAPLDGVDALSTMEHSVLGTRWVYDGCVDPVYVTAVADAILSGGVEAEMLVDQGGALERREPTTRVQGTGAVGAAIDVLPTALTAPTWTDEGNTTIIRSGGLEIVLYRVVDDATPEPTVGLTGTWPGHDTAATLAVVYLD